MKLKDIEKLLYEEEKDIFDIISNVEEYYLLYDKNKETLYVSLSREELLMKYLEKAMNANIDTIWELEAFFWFEMIERHIIANKKFIFTSNVDYEWSSLAMGNYNIKWVFEV